MQRELFGCGAGRKRSRCNGFPENFIVANPQFSNVTYQTNLGRNNYHSLQTQFTMRPTHGVGFQATYTWSKNLGIQNCCTGPANGGQSGNYVGLTDPLNRKLDYTLTGDDRTHVLQTNGTFELPIGPQKRYWVSLPACLRARRKAGDSAGSLML